MEVGTIPSFPRGAKLENEKHNYAPVYLKLGSFLKAQQDPTKFEKTKHFLRVPKRQAEGRAQEDSQEASLQELALPAVGVPGLGLVCSLPVSGEIVFLRKALQAANGPRCSARGGGHDGEVKQPQRPTNPGMQLGFGARSASEKLRNGVCTCETGGDHWQANQRKHIHLSGSPMSTQAPAKGLHMVPPSKQDKTEKETRKRSSRKPTAEPQRGEDPAHQREAANKAEPCHQLQRVLGLACPKPAKGKGRNN